MTTTSRRDRILAATIDLMLEQGLATTTRAVTERAGVGTGLLNHYYRWPDLRAAAWAAIYAAVTAEQFPAGAEADIALERYFAKAFAPEAAIYWKLWTEAVDLATSDPAMRAAVAQAQADLDAGLTALLRQGMASGYWRLPDAEATAQRLGALHDGLAGLLLAGIGHLSAGQAEQHLRQAFRLECGS